MSVMDPMQARRDIEGGEEGDRHVHYATLLLQEMSEET
jgi:hypothetical protein